MDREKKTLRERTSHRIHAFVAPFTNKHNLHRGNAITSFFVLLAGVVPVGLLIVAGHYGGQMGAFLGTIGISLIAVALFTRAGKDS